MSSNRPYLSIVAASRNDNHGGTLHRRMQTFINALFAQCQAYRLPTELILVEWNPPADRPPLLEALTWPAEREFCQLRIIQVSREIHRRYRYAQNLPLYQMLAKNVGIRRARGEFILSTNIDVLFSPELMEFLADRRLQSGKIYRMDRMDVETEAPMEGPETLAFCQTHQIRRHTRGGSMPVSPLGEWRLFPQDIVAPEAGISLGSGWPVPTSPAEIGGLSRWMENQAEIHFLPAPQARWLAMEYKFSTLRGYHPRSVEIRDDQGRLSLEEKLARQGTLVMPVLPGAQRLNLTLSGDHLENQAHSPDLAFLQIAWRPNDQTPGLDPGYPYHLLEGWLGFQDVALGYGRLMENRSLMRINTPARWLWMDVAPVEGIRQTRILLRDGVGGALLSEHLIQYRSIVSMALPNYSGSPREVLLELHSSESAQPGITVQTIRLLMEPHELPGDVLASTGLQLYPDRFWSGLEELLEESNLLRARFLQQSAAMELVLDGPKTSSRVPIRFTLEYQPGWPAEKGTLRLRNERGELLGEGPMDQSGQLTGQWEAQSDKPPVLHLELYDPQDRLIDKPRARRLAIMRLHLEALHAAAAPREKPPISRPAKYAPAYIHTNGCGDFTLLSRQDWLRLGAHPEIDIFSMHQDSLVCYMAQIIGLEEVILGDPMRLYHIEHSPGSGWTPEGENLLRQRLAKLQITEIDYGDLCTLATLMPKWRHPLFTPSSDWGLAQESLPEFGL